MRSICGSGGYGMTKKITLEAWANAQFDPPPCAETRRRWVRGLRIWPRPLLIGRQYYVDPQAEYIDPSDTNDLLGRIRRDA